MSNPSASERANDPKRSYGCFVCYAPADNQQVGRRWATWLQYQVLENYKIPRELVGTLNSKGETIPDRMWPAFVDDVDAASAELSSVTRRALEESRSLVVICSPRAAASAQVTEQIRYFKQMGREQSILAIVVDGEPHSSWNSDIHAEGFAPEHECFPASLLHPVDAQGQLQPDERIEPLAVDFRTNDGAQGWTSIEVYRDALLRDGGDEQDAETEVEVYAKTCETAKRTVIAFILGVKAGELTSRAVLRPAAGAAVGPEISLPDLPVPESKADDLIYDENVQFTVYRPKVVMPGKWHTMLAFAHLAEKAADAPESAPDPVQEVVRQAKQVLGNVESYRESTQDSSQAIPREGEITMVPEVDGIKFNPPRRSFLWDEPVHREEFRLMTRDATVETPKTVRGRVTIFLSSLIIAEIPLVFRIDTQEDAATSQPTETTQARPYRKVFASYSHRDMAVVQHLEHYAKALGDSYLRDILHLKPGEEWNARLLEMIEEADIFQLFWSSNSMRSRYVRQEWEYALSLNRPNFIRPTFWEDPCPALPAEGLPPPSLRVFHFQKIESAMLPKHGGSEPDDVVLHSTPRVESRPASAPERTIAAAPSPESSVAVSSSREYSPAPPRESAPTVAAPPMASGGTLRSSRRRFGASKIIGTVAVVAVVAGLGFRQFEVSRPASSSSLAESASTASLPAPSATASSGNGELAAASAPAPTASAPNPSPQDAVSATPDQRPDTSDSADSGIIVINVLKIVGLAGILVAVIGLVWWLRRRS